MDIITYRFFLVDFPALGRYNVTRTHLNNSATDLVKHKVRCRACRDCRPYNGYVEKEMTAMNDDFGTDLLTLIDEEGEQHEFEVLDVIENDEGCFYALLPTFDDPQEQLQSDGTYYIFEVIDEDGEEQLAEVEDEALLDRLAEEFERHFEELYDDEDDLPEDEE